MFFSFSNLLLFLQDDCPLASLPLLGYAVTLPNPHDNINKDFVFKLQFKNHIYFFRAESEYTFERFDNIWFYCKYFFMNLTAVDQLFWDLR